MIPNIDRLKFKYIIFKPVTEVIICVSFHRLLEDLKLFQLHLSVSIHLPELHFCVDIASDLETSKYSLQDIGTHALG